MVTLKGQNMALSEFNYLKNHLSCTFTFFFLYSSRYIMGSICALQHNSNPFQAQIQSPRC